MKMIRSPAIVIGEGFAGLTTALCLARKGIPVRVFADRGDRNAATPAAHGICTIKGILESDSDRFEAQLKGHRGFDSWLRVWEEFLNRPRPQMAWISGVSEAFTALREFKSEFGRIYRKDFMGAKDVILSPQYGGAFAETFYPGDFWVDPAYLIKTYQDCCLKLGVVFENRRVEKLVHDSDGTKVIFINDPPVTANSVVLCAGYGINQISVGCATPIEDLYAVAGYTFKSKSTSSPCCYVKKTASYAVIDGSLHLGSTSDRSVKVGHTAICERWRSPQDEQLLARTLFQETARGARETQTLDASSLQTRWGVRVRTRKRGPLVKKIHENSAGGVWINSGYYKSGIILSWLMAEKLSAKIAADLTGA